MEIFVYRKGAAKVEEGFSVEQLPELLKDPEAVIWIDMDQPTEADEQVLLNVFQFHPLTVEDCRENGHYPKVEEFPGYLYLIVHGVRADTSPIISTRSNSTLFSVPTTSSLITTTSFAASTT